MTGQATRKLLAYRERHDCYTVPFAQTRDLQVAALDEHLQDRVGRIKLVALRARQGDVDKIGSFADVVPLLLPHTAYKSYPENFLIEEKWDKLTKWLGTVSAYPVDDTDLENIADVDEWIERLEAAGHPVSCSSGTTGKSAMLVSSKFDVDWHCQDGVRACAWGSGVTPAQDRLVFGIAPVADMPRNEAIRNALFQAFGIPGSQRFNYPVPPITIGSITRMITLRRAIADGSARPGPAFVPALTRGALSLGAFRSTVFCPVLRRCAARLSRAIPFI